MNKKNVFIIIAIAILLSGCITSKSNLQKSPCACNSTNSKTLKV